MKTQRLIRLGVIILTVIIGWNLLNAHPHANPVLVFKGYGPAATNTAHLANFELRNTTSKSIWLCYSGAEFPLRTPFLERPIVVRPKTDNPQHTNIYSLSVGSFFMHGDELPPGQKLLLEFPLDSGKTASQVGIAYYVGNFKDGNDFLANMGTTILDQSASLKDKVAFYWQASKRHFRAPKRSEVWCPQLVCFQMSASNSSTAHPADLTR